ERYPCPVFALALPLAVARTRVLVPCVVLALTFALSLYYAFTRYEQYVDLRVPQIIEATIFSRPGQIGIALVMMGVAAYLVWRLVRGDARLESDYVWGGRGVPRQVNDGGFCQRGSARAACRPGATWPSQRSS